MDTDCHADLDPEQLRASLQLIRGQLNTAVRELRSYVHELHPAGTPRRLAEGLAALAEQVRVNARLRAELEVDEAIDQSLESEQIGQLLAIASEATFNAIRHAQAGSVRMRLRGQDGRLILLIADDGRGFDAHGSDRAHGRGLANMAERARLIGARFTLESRAGLGTEVRVELPIGEDPPRG